MHFIKYQLKRVPLDVYIFAFLGGIRILIFNKLIKLNHLITSVSMETAFAPVSVREPTQ
mgnify:FL=1